VLMITTRSADGTDVRAVDEGQGSVILISVEKLSHSAWVLESPRLALQLDTVIEFAVKAGVVLAGRLHSMSEASRLCLPGLACRARAINRRRTPINEVANTVGQGRFGTCAAKSCAVTGWSSSLAMIARARVPG
jgi:hypothetical protein